MNFTKTLSAGVAALALSTAFVAVTSTTAYAQQTDAGVRGTVISASGAPLSGATVTIVHTPSGTRDTATTSANGTFFEGGLRVGGPYTITVAKEGFEPAVREGLYLEPGAAERVIIDLQRQADGDQVLVIGTRTSQQDLNNGVGSSFDASTIASQPSVTRDVLDTLARDPLANLTGGNGVVTIAGVNPKLNALALDGVLQGDDFGLSNSVYATANRSPISLDAVESASIVSSAYDVKSTGFQGGLINIVTKSGTNDFHGSGYWYRSGQDFRGELSDGQLVPSPEFEEREWGFSLGGPIIKDRLFFFANYEKFNSSQPENFVGDDAQNGILDSEAFFNTLNQKIFDGLGYDAGGRPASTSLPATTKRFLGKIDFNINDDHRLEASYQRTRETGTSVSANRFVSSWYETPVELDSYAGGIYSDWSDNLSTTIRVGFKDNTRGQICNAGGDVNALILEEFSYADVSADPDFAGLIDSTFGGEDFEAGCDRFRHANEFDDKRLQIFAAADYTWGDHITSFGGEIEDYSLRNVFVESSNGTYRYENLNELLTNTGAEITYRNVVSNNIDEAAQNWGFTKMTAFLQDEWQVTPNFAFNAGLRYERFFQGDQPVEREDFIAAYGRTNTKNLDGIDIFLPRVGFTYEPFDRTTLTGGFGLFAGGNPQVWVSNVFAPRIIEVDGDFDGETFGTGVPQSLLDQVAATDPTVPAGIDLIADDFKVPSQWKGSLRLQQGFDADLGFVDLGDDYQLTVQYLFSSIKNDFAWSNLAQTDLGLPTGVAPDGRPIYANIDELGLRDAIQLENVSGGRSHIVSAALAKSYDNGFNFDVSYAFQDVETINPGTSSRGISAFRAFMTSDRNNPEVGTSPFEIRHAFNVNLGYENTFFGDLVTRLDLFGTIRSGENNTFTFDVGSSNPLFGRSDESPRDNDLLYIPTIAGGVSTDPRVVFDSTFDGNAFEGFVNDQGLTQGAIVGRATGRAKWDQLWNFRFEQELPFADLGMKRLEGNKLKFVADVFNVANLINDKWGTRFDGARFDAQGLVDADIVYAGTTTEVPTEIANTECATEGACQYLYKEFDAQPSSFVDLDDSVYRIRVGVRYEF